MYHLPEGPGALSAPIKPLKADGVTVDTDVLARLHPRHDDSEENVCERLRLWDVHEPALRAAYEDVALRVPAGTGAMPTEAIEEAAEFLSLESRVPGEEVEVVPSPSLKELQYEVVDTLRWVARLAVGWVVRWLGGWAVGWQVEMDGCVCHMWMVFRRLRFY